MSKIWLGRPNYEGKVTEMMDEAMNRATGPGFVIDKFKFSILPTSFNHLLCNALNNRKEKEITHFCLLHSDIVPETKGWLEMMIDEMKRFNLHAISVVSPIKSPHGITSTAIDLSQYPGQNEFAVRRLVMKEIMRLPETFMAEDVTKIIPWDDKIEPVLLVNTGLFMIDLEAPDLEKHVEEGKLNFEFVTKIRRNPHNMKFEALTLPEDWGFSKMMHRVGWRWAATRRIQLAHIGDWIFTNDQAWGLCDTDPDCPVGVAPGEKGEYINSTQTQEPQDAPDS